MANLTPTPGWDDVPQLETTTPVLGGPGGVANAQAQALLNRFAALAGTGSGQGASLVGASVATDYADNTLGFLVVKNTGTAYNALKGFSKANQTLIQNYGYGVDTTTQLLAMLADSGIQELYLPHGGWLITANISIPNLKHLKGAGYGLSAGQAPTRILKRGAFNGVYVNAGSQLSNLSVEGDTGNTGDGVTLISGRSRICNVSSFAHGQDGFKIGPYTAGGNANLWDLRGLISRSNTRHGMLIEHTGETTLPNAGAGILTGYEASFNGGDGLQVGSTIDNQLYGVVCQTNTGWGVRYKQYAKGNFMPLAYTENNTLGDTTYESGADRNFLFGFRNGLVNDGIVNNGAENMIVGRHGSIEGIPLHRAAEAFFNLRIFDSNASPTSGQWALTKENVTRHLRVDLTSTGSSADLMIGNTGGGVAGLRFGTSTNDGAIRGLKNRIGTALNFGLIPANSSTDVTVAVSGADNTWSFIASPTHAIPAGVSWCAYWDATAVAVKVRCLNGTAAGVTVNGSFILTAFKNA